MDKKLKDPIYGYINIPNEYMTDIVDTAIFQRLRRIVQTSYSPLYSSAVHNRFVHSLGVYHLGRFAAETLTKEINNKIGKNIPDINIKDYTEVFCLACLLHDVGHAPFSHTGENFFLPEDHNRAELHKYLNKAVGKVVYDTEKSNVKSAAAHEIMSAIIGIDSFGNFIGDTEHKEFFARCITGYLYDNSDLNNKIKNCFISLLNSHVIDVDKLDYLIRDAYETGFDNVNIDYIRLLSSITISDVSDNHTGNYQIAYYKNALSVIENVVYARDSEKKWIQSHPVVLYEAYLIQHMIRNLSLRFNNDGHKLFSIKSLSEAGNEFLVEGKTIKISLLCDDDIIYLTKNMFPDNYSKQYFSRRSRKHPIWKSEPEYKALIYNALGDGDYGKQFSDAMERTVSYLEKYNNNDTIINETIIKKLESEIEKINNSDEYDKNDLSNIGSVNEILNDRIKILCVAEALKCMAAKNHINNFNFTIIKATQFSSGFGDADFSEINIAFKTAGDEKVEKFGRIASSISALQAKNNNFYYIYYNRVTENGEPKKIDAVVFCDDFISEVLKNLRDSHKKMVSHN